MIERTLTLPSGGTVEFIDEDDLTGGDVQAIRRMIKAEDSAGETSNQLQAKVAEVMIHTWDVPYLADPRTPQANPAALRKLKARDLLAIERHLEPVLDLIKGKQAVASVDDTSPGSPTQPDSE